MGNPFEVRVPNALEALMAGDQGYKGMSDIMTERAQSEARKLAAQDFQSGNPQSAIARLLGAGDHKSVNALVQHQAAASGVHGTPIMLQKPDGSYGVGAIGKDGRPNIIDFGPGMSPTVPAKSVDTGTGTYIIPGRVTGGQPGAQPQPSAQPQQPALGGQPSEAPSSQASLPVRSVPTQSYYPKDVAGEASQKVYGREEGEAKANLASMRAKLPGLKVVTEQLGRIGDVAAYTKAGQLLDYGRSQANLPPRPEAIARTKYIAMVDNQVLPLLRETFGAQFTQKEGESLKTTLGDPEKSPQEKRAVLEAFIEQKVRNIEALQMQTGGGNKNLTGPGKTITGVDVQTVPAGVTDWRTYFGVK
jgi:hypothetical protein